MYQYKTIKSTVIICFTSVLIILLLSVIVTADDVNTIPETLSIGAATASYQIEGAWDADGKGESIWDHFSHTHPEYFTHLNGDVADDSYHKYEEDIKALKDIGMQHYRFSISWPRILPTGDITNINQKGIDYYNALINGLIENGITPVVTMYHWDLPQSLQELGGWVNPVLVDYFEDYARILYTQFGDRVKWWITFNEPFSFTRGYADTSVAPGINASGVGEYLAGHTLLKAHARAYHLYDEEFRTKQQGKVAIALDSFYAFPYTDSENDLKAVDQALQDHLGWFAHPIYSEEGDYPAVLKERLAYQSEEEGRDKSRLPEFDEYWINYIRGTADYFGLNHYYSYNASYRYDYSYDLFLKEDCTSRKQCYEPEGFRGLINWVTSQYNRPDIFITENGWADETGLNDTLRIHYLNGYMADMLKSIHLNNSSVIGYTVWTLMDNIEWTSGISIRYGLYEVDFDNPELPRTPRDSAKAMANIISSRQVSEEYFKDVL